MPSLEKACRNTSGLVNLKPIKLVPKEPAIGSTHPDRFRREGTPSRPVPLCPASIPPVIDLDVKYSFLIRK